MLAVLTRVFKPLVSFAHMGLVRRVYPPPQGDPSPAALEKLTEAAKSLFNILKNIRNRVRLTLEQTQVPLRFHSFGAHSPICNLRLIQRYRCISGSIRRFSSSMYSSTLRSCTSSFGNLKLLCVLSLPPSPSLSLSLSLSLSHSLFTNLTPR